MEEWRERLDRIEALMNENAKGFVELRKQQEENAKGFAELRKFLDEVGERIDKTNEIVNGTSESNGKFSEAYFYNSLFNSMRFGGKDFDEIEKGMKRTKKLPNGEKLKGEYDVVMYNGDTVALIEIKYKVRKKDLETLAGTQINVFRQLFPQYVKHKFYLGIAGMSFEDNT
ncbi:MAG: hypothetical protein LBH98_00880, partial [Chitinispirillales bacterium]|nr:hypothetical protein [Chitinispirillales bacterium]